MGGANATSVLSHPIGMKKVKNIYGLDDLLSYFVTEWSRVQSHLLTHFTRLYNLLTAYSLQTLLQSVL